VTSDKLGHGTSTVTTAESLIKKYGVTQLSVAPLEHYTWKLNDYGTALSMCTWSVVLLASVVVHAPVVLVS
jgi:hypothetical protein